MFFTPTPGDTDFVLQSPREVIDNSEAYWSEVSDELGISLASPNKLTFIETLKPLVKEGLVITRGTDSVQTREFSEDEFGYDISLPLSRYSVTVGTFSRKLARYHTGAFDAEFPFDDNVGKMLDAVPWQTWWDDIIDSPILTDQTLTTTSVIMMAAPEWYFANPDKANSHRHKLMKLIQLCYYTDFDDHRIPYELATKIRQTGMQTYSWNANNEQYIQIRLFKKHRTEMICTNSVITQPTAITNIVDISRPLQLSTPSGLRSIWVRSTNRRQYRFIWDGLHYDDHDANNNLPNLPLRIFEDYNRTRRMTVHPSKNRWYLHHRGRNILNVDSGRTVDNWQPARWQAMPGTSNRISNQQDFQ